jgi:hypothetical protein
MSTTIQEIYDRNTRRLYSKADEQELEKAGKALGENRLDFVGSGAQKNIDLIDEIFQADRNLQVTAANIYAAVEKRKTEFVWLTPAQHDWYKSAQQNPDLANQVATYLASTSGRPGALAKNGEDLFVNLFLLFMELQNRRESVSAQTIFGAEDRIAHRPGPQLRRISQPRRTEPVSAAAKNDDGAPFLGTGLTKQKDGSLGKSPADYARERAAAQEAANPKPQSATQLSTSDQAWKKLALEATQFGTHSDQAQIRKLYDQLVSQGAEWRQVFDECARLRDVFKRRREQMR